MPRLRTAFLIAVLLVLGSASSARAVRGWPARAVAVPTTGVPGRVDAAVTADGRTAGAWSADGRAVTVTVAPGLDPTRVGTGGQVHATAAGDAVVFTWMEDTDQPAAAMWSAATGLVRDLVPAGGDWALPLAAADAAGDAVLAYAGGGRTSTRWRPAGGTFGPPVDVGPGTPWGLGVGSAGHVVVGVGATTARQVAGGPAVPAGPVPIGGTFDRQPHIAVDAAGRAAVVAKEVTTGPDGAVAAAASAPGTGWAVLAGVTGTASNEPPGVGVDDAGRLVAAWSAPADGLGPAGLRLATADLATGTADAVTAPGMGSLFTPQVRVRPDGAALVVAGEGDRIHALRRAAGGAFGAPELASCVPGTQVAGADLGAAGEGTIAFVLRDGNPLYVARDADGQAVATSPACLPAPQAGGQPQQQQAVVTPVVPAPSATVRAAKGQRLKAVLRKGVRFSVTSPVAVTMRARLWAAAGEAKRLRLGRKATVVGARKVQLKAGTTSFRVALSKAAKRRLRRARRPVALQLRLTHPSGARLATTVRLTR